MHTLDERTHMEQREQGTHKMSASQEEAACRKLTCGTQNRKTCNESEVGGGEGLQNKGWALT